MTRLFLFAALAGLASACSADQRSARAPLPGDTTLDPTPVEARTEPTPAEPARAERATTTVPGATSPRAEMNAIPDHDSTLNEDYRAGLAAIRDPAVASAPLAPPTRTGTGADTVDRPVSSRSPSDLPTPPMSRAQEDPDLRLIQQIRDAVRKDDSLSVRAKAVKIIATEGKVTLRGTVENEREWTVLDEQAVHFAGAGNVDNQVQVKAHK